MNAKRLNEIKGVVLIAAGLIVLASLISFNPFDLSFYTSDPNVPPRNWIRGFGAYLAGALLFLFGWAAYVIPAFMLYLGVRLFRQEIPDIRPARMIGLGVCIVSLSCLAGMLQPLNKALQFSYGGYMGFAVSSFVINYFGRLGAGILFSTLLILSFALVTEVLISSLVFSLIEKCKESGFPWCKGTFRIPLPLPKPGSSQKKPAVKPVKPGRIPADEPAPLPFKAAEPSKPKILMPAMAQKAEVRDPKPKAAAAQMQAGEYQLPSLDLLDTPPAFDQKQMLDDLEGNARTLEETMSDFGIEVKVTDIMPGPVITRYELEPAPGVKLNRIVALEDDIALALKAPSIRILAPIPGKARVGVEIPNKKASMVYLKDVLATKDFQEAKASLMLALGKDIAGVPVMADLSGMPHMLIAGTTGSGKTVCVNTLIVSLLMKYPPQDLKFVMVDPKMVELAPYNGLPHLLCPVVTDAKKASVALAWVVSEMEERYQRLSEAGARNIAAYNEKRKDSKMPYIVVIIDEMADLMIVARDQIEGAITRLAQLSRAVGIHLVMATQRPSVDVVTGVIKANFPARISFKVASKVDSRTVLDGNGADKLLGRGDMLFLKPGEEHLTRAQGALVKDQEIERIVDFIKKQAEPVYNEEILNEQQRAAAGISGEKDEMFDEGVRVVMETGQASVSIIQRRLRLGYTRAARLIDMMESEGLVGPFEGSKPRRITVDREAWLREHMSMKPQVQQEGV